MQAQDGIERYDLLDSLRGFLLLQMVVYHFFWDMLYLFEWDLRWFQSSFSYWWQQSVCWLFIFLSGFCWSLGSKPFLRGLKIVAASFLITLATHIFVPQQPVVFGILFFMGSCMILLSVFAKWTGKLEPAHGIILNFSLFFLARNINEGYLGFEQWNLIKLPEFLYQNMLTAYLGFPAREFYSSDYFSLLPWMFLFMSGYYTFAWCRKKGPLPGVFYRGNRSLSFCGRNSLLIYLLHQPLLYLLIVLSLK